MPFLKLIISIYIDNHNQIAKKPKQKLSLDNQYNQQNYQNHQQFMNNYQTNNFINNNNKQSIKRNGKEMVDSFSEDSNDDDDDERMAPADCERRVSDTVWLLLRRFCFSMRCCCSICSAWRSGSMDFRRR